MNANKQKVTGWIALRVLALNAASAISGGLSTSDEVEASRLADAILAGRGVVTVPAKHRARVHAELTARSALAPIVDVDLHIMQRNADAWVPAANGTETPISTRSGRRLLYCWQESSMTHAYLDLDTDMILTDNQAFDAFNQ